MSKSNPFKWRHYEPEIILLCVRWYLTYPLSYRTISLSFCDRVFCPQPIFATQPSYDTQSHTYLTHDPNGVLDKFLQHNTTAFADTLIKCGFAEPMQ